MIEQEIEACYFSSALSLDKNHQN